MRCLISPPDCVLLVLANKIYDPEDYIRDHETFVSMTKERS
ncbi:WxcM-like domain-containing protein [Ralstonia sp. GP101]